jgi:hypothetical protein
MPGIVETILDGRELVLAVEARDVEQLANGADVSVCS